MTKQGFPSREKVTKSIFRKARGKISFEKKEVIEAELGVPLIWEDCAGKAARIKIEKNISLTDATKWDTAYEWFLNTGEKFLELFPRYL